MNKTKLAFLFSVIFVSVIILSGLVSAITSNYSYVRDTTNGEYKLYYSGAHVASLIYSNGVFVIRPHPGSDVNGWGSSLYLQPFLPGATLRNSKISSISVTSTQIKVSVSGKVSKSTSSTYGSWSSTLYFTYDPKLKSLKATGTYAITLSSKLSSTTGDLNIYKLATNYLDDVPKLDGTTGDTGDISSVAISGTNFNHNWNPSTEPTYFPSEQMTTMTVNALGQYNNVDSARQGYAAIAAAYKPSISITLSPYSSSYNAPMNFGGFYDTTKAKDFWEDNVGITPLILKTSTLKSFKFNVLITSTPIAGDSTPINTTNNTIKCYTASDCGTETYSSNFCYQNNVFANVTTYGCRNPGTTASYCSSTFGSVLMQSCSLGCSSNKCNTQTTNCVTPTDGMNITKDTTLCQGTYNLPNGLVVTTSGITLDCNGATLQGNQTFVYSNGAGYGTYGIDSNSGVTVKNCKIGGYYYGIYDWNTFNSKYINNTIFNNSEGIWLDSCSADLIQGNNFISNTDNALVLYWYNYATLVEKNTFTNNSIGFTTDWGAHNNVIRNNTFTNNVFGAYDGGSYDRITNNNNYTDNKFMNNRWGLYFATYCTKGFVSRNNFASNEIGIYVGGQNNTFTLNNFLNNRNSSYAYSTFNNWSYANKGNYWSDYDSSEEGCLDVNSDGMCDTSYTKSPGVVDSYPFVSAFNYIL